MAPRLIAAVELVETTTAELQQAGPEIQACLLLWLPVPSSHAARLDEVAACDTNSASPASDQPTTVTHFFVYGGVCFSKVVVDQLELDVARDGR